MELVEVKKMEETKNLALENSVKDFLKVKPIRGMKLKNKTGAIVLEYKLTQLDKGYIILVIIPRQGEYVTWWMNEEGNTFHGHYTLDLGDAIEDFKARL